MYCKKDQLLFEGNTCPLCGEQGRQPEDNDPVFLWEGSSFLANMLMPLLEDHQVPYSKITAMGAGFDLQAGSILESYKIYVPYIAYMKAKDLLEFIHEK